MSKKRILTGIKPSGDLHIGNYFGAIKQLLDLQESEEGELFVFVANYHAMNSVHSKDELEKNSKNILKAYISLGLNPDKTTIYLQSDVPEVHELAWFFATQSTMPELMRAHAFKDAQAKNKDINVGTFYYPILMAADILIMDADMVPVGKDQRQHVEMAREMARDFNMTYGEHLKEPKERISKELQTIPGTDGRKMSKSYKNVIPLFGSDEEWRKAIFSIKTGSEPLDSPLDPGVCNVFALHKLFLSEKELKELESRYKEGSIGYKESKELLFEKIHKKFADARERYNALSDDELFDILQNSRKRAQKVAKEKIKILRKAAGVI